MGPNRYIWLPVLCLTPPTEGFPWDDLRNFFSWMSTDGDGTEYRRNIAKNYNRLSRSGAQALPTYVRRTRDSIMANVNVDEIVESWASPPYIPQVVVTVVFGVAASSP